MSADFDVQRAYDELVLVCQRYETENELLRGALKLRQSIVVAVKPPPKPVVPAPVVGGFVEYVDAGGIAHAALVLEVLAGALKVKVYRHARKDIVLELRRAQVAGQRSCWRMR
jgi:hypothetical protein